MKKVLCALLILVLALALLLAPAAEAEQKTFSITGVYHSDHYGVIANITVRVGGTCPACQEGVLYGEFQDARSDLPAYHYIRCSNRDCEGKISENCSGGVSCGQEGYCQVCGNLYHGVHDYRIVNKTDPTCTKVGYRCDCWYCVKCQHYFDAVNAVLTDVVIPALGHDLVHHDGKAPTCAEVGWEEYDTCSRCDYTTYQEIPVSAAAHIPGAPVREEPYLIPGLYDMVTYCTVCGQELSREPKMDRLPQRTPKPTPNPFDTFCLDLVKQIQTAPENGELAADGHRWDVLPYTVIEALALRPDVTLKITCRVDRALTELIIPGSFDLLTPLEESGRKFLTFDEIADLIG